MLIIYIYFNMIFYLNNSFYLSIMFFIVTLVISYRYLRQRRRSEVNILKMIKKVEDKLIEI